MAADGEYRARRGRDQLVGETGVQVPSELRLAVYPEHDQARSVGSGPLQNLVLGRPVLQLLSRNTPGTFGTGNVFSYSVAVLLGQFVRGLFIISGAFGEQMTDVQPGVEILAEVDRVTCS